jgi:hypothetical protein
MVFCSDDQVSRRFPCHGGFWRITDDANGIG